jgi:hypothetical protein
VPDVVDRSLSDVHEPIPPKIVPLPILFSQQGNVTRQARFDVPNLAALGAIDELQLPVERHGAPSQLLSARLELGGTACAFALRDGTPGDTTTLTLSRERPCPAASAPGAAILTVHLAAASPADGRVGLFISPRPTGPPALMTLAEGAGPPVGRAIRVRSAAVVTRIDLLSWMWNLTAAELWLRVGVAAVLLILAAVVLAALDVARPAASGVFVCLVAASLGLFYAALVPPLQAPDEPDHLLGFARLTGRTDMPAATAAWAQRTHFDRIAFRNLERFRPADRESAYDRPWSELDVFAQDVAERSIAATRWWQLLSPLLPAADPARVVLNVRSANAVLIGLALGFGTALLVAGGAGSAMTSILLAIPTLPFFAMQMSEITPNLVAFVLIAFAAGGLLLNPDDDRIGMILGLSAALVAAGTRNGWPLAALVAALLCARIMARFGSAGPSLRFWAAFAAPTLVLFGTGILSVPIPSYDQWRLPVRPEILMNRAAVVTATAATAALGLAIEWALCRPTLKAAVPLGPFRVVTGAVAAWIVAMLVASPFVQLPLMQAIDAGPADYVWRVLMTIVTTPRVTGPDFLLWTSFLGTFGWVDTQLPELMRTALTVAASLAGAWLLRGISRDPDARRSAVVCLAGAGILASLVGCALGAYGMHRAVHGRYMLGPYLAAIGLLGALPIWGKLGRARAETVVLTMTLAIHAVSARVILERYFG